MTASNRAARIAKLHTSLKKHYKPVPNSNRPLMEHLLYACLLEGAPAELADEGLAKLEQQYFDWNEVRVTTVSEIAELLSSLPNPMNAATRLKRCLQSAFETFYSFDLEDLKKQNLGKAVEQFEALPGMTPFVLSSVAQHGLGGHSIPVDSYGLRIMFACGIINEAEMVTRKVPGLERAIPKSKGMEFGSLLQQASIALRQDPQDKTVHAMVTAVDKDAVKSLEILELALKASAKVATESVKDVDDEASKSSAKKGPAKKAATKKTPAKKVAKKVEAKEAPKKEAKPAKAPAKKLTKRKPR